MSTSIILLIFHGLVAVALLGALTHQSVSLIWDRFRTPANAPASNSSFVSRYTKAGKHGFANAIVGLYILCIVFAILIYPAYRTEVRVLVETMGAYWVVGIFEVKEHWGGIGLGVLPFYAYLWQADQLPKHRTERMAITLLLAFIVWADFLVGHVLNNFRGLP